MSVAIRACWQPASELPRFDEPTNIIVTFPPGPQDDPESGWYLARSVYLVSPSGKITDEHDGITLLSENFWWCEESALLAGLPI